MWFPEMSAVCRRERNRLCCLFKGMNKDFFDGFSYFYVFSVFCKHYSKIPLLALILIHFLKSENLKKKNLGRLRQKSWKTMGALTKAISFFRHKNNFEWNSTGKMILKLYFFSIIQLKESNTRWQYTP